MLVISGSGLSGIWLLYYLSTNNYKEKIIMFDKNGLGSRNVSMFSFIEKLQNYFPVLKNYELLDYMDCITDKYNYSMIEKNGLIDYRTISQKNLTGIVNYQKLCEILFKESKDKLDLIYTKGNISDHQDNLEINNSTIENYDLFIDSMGYNSPINCDIKRPSRFYHLKVAKYENSIDKETLPVRMIVNLTKGGCWIYPNSKGFEIGTSLLTYNNNRTDKTDKIINNALLKIEEKLNLNSTNRISEFNGRLCMEPILNIYDKQRKIIRVGDGVGMIDPYLGAGSMVIPPEMKDLSLNITKPENYVINWINRIKETYLPRLARSMIMFGNSVNDEIWRNILIKRSKADVKDVINKGAGNGRHSFWFNIRLLPPRTLFNLEKTKRMLKKNIINHAKMVPN